LEKFIYLHPLDVFDELEREELIKVEKRDCPECKYGDCVEPKIIIINQEKLDNYLRKLVDKVSHPIEKAGINDLIGLGEEMFEIFYHRAYSLKRMSMVMNRLGLFGAGGVPGFPPSQVVKKKPGVSPHGYGHLN
jgi:hypothetical protein